jgi:hypothetical protein
MFQKTFRGMKGVLFLRTGDWHISIVGIRFDMLDFDLPGQ